MIFVGNVMLLRREGIMVKFSENGVGGSYQSTRFYVGTEEQNNSITIKFKGNSSNGITPQVTEKLLWKDSLAVFHMQKEQKYYLKWQKSNS